MSRQTARLVVILITFAGLARGVAAQEVGTIAAVEGTVEISHGGTWAPATMGTGLRRGDKLRTARPGRTAIVFGDDSLLNVGTGTELLVEEVVAGPDQKNVRSRLRLLAGKIRSAVSSRYKRTGGVYEIETSTAIASAHGTEFVVAYDPVAELSEVVGVGGTVEVRSPRTRVGRGVMVTTQELTSVPKGKQPTTPKHLVDKLFRQYIEDLEFIGGGSAEGVAAKHPLITSELVPPVDRVDAMTGPPIGETPASEVHPVIARPPWPIIVVPPGEGPIEIPHCLGCVVDGPTGVNRTTGDLGIGF